MQLIFLGTGAGMPTKERGLSSLVLDLLNERGAIWLFDCGEGTQQQILHTTIKLSKLEKIFITHLHGDHIFGLPGVLGSRSMQGITEPLTLYGPLGIKEFIDTVMRLSGSYLTYPLEIVEISDGLVFVDELFQVHAATLNHRVESFGYRIVERPRVGALDAQRLVEQGVKPGPLFQRLKRGESVQLEDGRILDGKDFLGPPQLGKVVAILGDTAPVESALVLAACADVLVHETTLDASMAVSANERGHSTTEQAANLAKAAGVKKLIASHISGRYTRRDTPRLLDECRQIFANTELASDFSVYEV